MAVLGGFDDSGWFALQNDQNAPHHNMGFINDNNIQEASMSNWQSQLEFLQRQELEQILHFQNEKLRYTLHEQRKQQLAILMRSLEAKAARAIRQKDDDLARAATKGLHLQNMLSRAETESRTWQRIARANEATVTELNGALQQALCKQNDNGEGQNDSNGAADAVSSCFGSSDDSPNDRKWVCRTCKTQASCVVLLPCKHLCSCETCEASLRACPVCGTVKQGSFEVFLV